MPRPLVRDLVTRHRKGPGGVVALQAVAGHAFLVLEPPKRREIKLWLGRCRAQWIRYLS
ncbi:hypothetical protein LIA77_07203 [Sarocladium implicatum]|nr:hypothetical protein LIA77_07203 [Sarocladium implicatum]